MNKFKVGDKVRLICDKSCINERYHHFFGLNLHIKAFKTIPNDREMVTITECMNDYIYWYSDWFELVEEKPKEYCFNCGSGLSNNRSHYNLQACIKCGNNLKRIDEETEKAIKDRKEAQKTEITIQAETIKELVLNSLAPIIAENVILKQQIEQLKKEQLESITEFSGKNQDTFIFIPPTIKEAAENLKNSAVSQRMDYLKEGFFYNLNCGNCKEIIKINIGFEGKAICPRCKHENIIVNQKEEPKPLDTYHGKGFMMGTDFNQIFSTFGLSNSFNNFRTKDQAEQARKHLQITCALLNFRAENDKEELSNQWNGKNEHWFIGYECVIYDENIWLITCVNNFKHPTSVYFSSKELAQSALDMLKRKGLINEIFYCKIISS